MLFRRKHWEAQPPLNLLVEALGVGLTAEILLTDVRTVTGWKKGRIMLEPDQEWRVRWFRDAILWFREYCSTTASIKSWFKAYKAEFMCANNKLEEVFKDISRQSLENY